MTRKEANRTIVMLANQLAKAEQMFDVSQTELELARTMRRELEKELEAYREEDQKRQKQMAPKRAAATVDWTSGVPDAAHMSFGAAIELMCRRPGLELIDNESDKWRVNNAGELEICWRDNTGAWASWELIGLDHDWTLLTFRVATDADSRPIATA